MDALPFLKMMSISQLISSLGKELDDLRARVASLEGLLGVAGVSDEKSSNTEGSCRMCGITWQLGVTCLPQHMAGRRHKANLARANLARLSINPPSFSSKKGTGHTEYRATMCNKDILNGMAQIQGNVLGRLQSITCMKEYKKKSFEELHWEDLKTGRRGWAEHPVDKVGEGFWGQGDGGTSSCKENEGVELKGEKSAADEQLTVTEGVRKDSPAVEVTGDLTSFKDGESGAGLKEGSPVDVKGETATAVVDNKGDMLAASKESDQKSPAVCEIISIRPRLKKAQAKKV